MLGIVGGSMAFIAAAGALFDVYDQNSGAQFLLTIPEIIREASLAVYLIRRGFRSEGLARLGKPAVAGVTGTPAIAPT